MAWTVEIFSKDNCPYCVKAKALLDDNGYTEYKVGEDISRDDFFAKFPGHTTVPQIVINGEHIGGHDNLVKWLAFHDTDNVDF